MNARLKTTLVVIALAIAGGVYLKAKDPHVPWWMLVVAVVAAAVVPTVGRSVWGRASNDKNWDWERMSGSKRFTALVPVPSVSEWRDGVFFDMKWSGERFIDLPAFCIQVHGTSAPELWARIDDLRPLARSWTQLDADRAEVVFDRPSTEAGRLADFGARLMIKTSGKLGAATMQIVVYSGGYGNGGLPARGLEGGLHLGRELADVLIPNAGLVPFEIASDYMIEIERTQRGAAVWWTVLADRFGIGAEAVAAVKGAKLAKAEFAGTMSSISVKRVAIGIGIVLLVCAVLSVALALVLSQQQL